MKNYLNTLQVIKNLGFDEWTENTITQMIASKQEPLVVIAEELTLAPLLQVKEQYNNKQWKVFEREQKNGVVTQTVVKSGNEKVDIIVREILEGNKIKDTSVHAQKLGDKLYIKLSWGKKSIQYYFDDEKREDKVIKSIQDAGLDEKIEKTLVGLVKSDFYEVGDFVSYLFENYDWHSGVLNDKELEKTRRQLAKTINNQEDEYLDLRVDSKGNLQIQLTSVEGQKTRKTTLIADESGRGVLKNGSYNFDFDLGENTKANPGKGK